MKIKEYLHVFETISQNQLKHIVHVKTEVADEHTCTLEKCHQTRGVTDKCLLMKSTRFASLRLLLRAHASYALVIYQIYANPQ